MVEANQGESRRCGRLMKEKREKDHKGVSDGKTLVAKDNRVFVSLSLSPLLLMLESNRQDRQTS